MGAGTVGTGHISIPLRKKFTVVPVPSRRDRAGAVAARTSRLRHVTSARWGRR